jgi:hypothetical protein
VSGWPMLILCIAYVFLAGWDAWREAGSPWRKLGIRRRR